MNRVNGIYCDENGIILPLAETLQDDIRKHPITIKETLETPELRQLKQEYEETLRGMKVPLRHNEPWCDEEIEEIIREEDTIETRLTFAIIFDRTPDAIAFIQAYAKRITPTKIWMDFHKTYLQTKRCQVKLRQITQEDYDEIEKLCRRVHKILHEKQGG